MHDFSMILGLAASALIVGGVCFAVLVSYRKGQVDAYRMSHEPADPLGSGLRFWNLRQTGSALHAMHRRALQDLERRRALKIAAEHCLRAYPADSKLPAQPGRRVPALKLVDLQEKRARQPRRSFGE